jgi:dUTP pyrophosphatase
MLRMEPADTRSVPNPIHVPFVRLDPEARTPTRAHEGDAGYDLRSVEEAALEPGERSVVRTGLGVAIPRGYAGLVLPRSGLATRHGISPVNAPGLIDSGYRGEIQVPLINLDPRETFRVEVGMRIAQLVFVRAAEASFVAVDLLEGGTDGRGEGGFGSSGTH